MLKKRTPTKNQRKALGNLFRRRQKSSGFTQEELAFFIGCSPHWISMLENGKSNPNWLDAFRLAYILGLSVSDILEEVDGGVPVSSN